MTIQILVDLGNFSWISLLDLLAFWNFERRFSNLEADLYMTMTAASVKVHARVLRITIIK
jgi:hypothetical protein